MFRGPVLATVPFRNYDLALVFGWLYFCFLFITGRKKRTQIELKSCPSVFVLELGKVFFSPQGIMGDVKLMNCKTAQHLNL